MLHKEIFSFFAKIYFSSNISESDKCNPKSFFCFTNNILESAEMEHIAENKRNYNRFKKLCRYSNLENEKQIQAFLHWCKEHCYEKLHTEISKLTLNDNICDKVSNECMQKMDDSQSNTLPSLPYNEAETINIVTDSCVIDVNISKEKACKNIEKSLDLVEDPDLVTISKSSNIEVLQTSETNLNSSESEQKLNGSQSTTLPSLPYNETEKINSVTDNSIIDQSDEQLQEIISDLLNSKTQDILDSINLQYTGKIEPEKYSSPLNKEVKNNNTSNTYCSPGNPHIEEETLKKIYDLSNLKTNSIQAIDSANINDLSKLHNDSLLTSTKLSDIIDTTDSDIMFDEYSVIRKKIQINTIPTQPVEIIKTDEVEVMLQGYPYVAGTYNFKRQQIDFLKEYFMKDGKITNKNKFTKYVEDLVRENFYSVLNNDCPINIMSFAYTKSMDTLRIYAKCIYENEGCRKYKFHVNLLDPLFLVKVYTNEPKKTHPSNIKKQQIRGLRRLVAKNEVKDKHPSNIRNEWIIKQPRALRNIQSVPSKEVVRKIKSEVLQSKSRNPDIVWDILLMQREKKWSNFIQRISVPQEIYLFSQEQLSLPSKHNSFFLKKGRNTLFIDATGGICKKFNCDSKRVFLYSIVMHVPEENKSGFVIPIAEALVARHYEDDVKRFLLDIKVFCLQNKIKWPLSKRICVDWSWALINASVKIINNLDSITSYLYNCLTILEGNLKINPNFTVIQICCNHFIKICIKDIQECSENEEQKEMLKKCMTKAINICFLGDLWVWYKNVITILLCKYENQETKTALKYFHSETDAIEEEVTTKSLKNNEHGGPQYQKSPFYKKAVEIYENFKINNKLQGTINKLRNPPFFNIILKKYIPYAVLWTNMMGHKIDGGDKTRISNAPIECYFNINKNITLNGKRHIRPSAYARLSKRFIQAQIKEINYNINLNDKTSVSGKPIKRKNEQLVEDHWKRTPKRVKNCTNVKEMVTEKVFQNHQCLSDIYSNKKIPNKLKNVRIILYIYDQVFNELKKEVPPFVRSICLHDFQSLNPRKEIYNSIIDLYSNIIFLKHKIADAECLPCEFGIALFNNKTIKNLKEIPSIKNKTIVTIPIHTVNHFTFAFINFELKEFYYIDPMKASEKDEKVKFNRFLECIDTNSGWTLKTVEHYKQDDSYNCGILCLQFMEALLTKTSLKTIINPDKYRYIIKNDLIKYGNSEMNCMFCETKTSQSVVNCIQCKRGVDNDCHKYIKETLKINTPQPFLCFICQK